MPPFDPSANDGLNELEPWLQNGTLWITRVPLKKGEFSAGVIPYAERVSAFQGPEIPKGAVALYSGGVHVDERDRQGRDMRVWRHTFIINGARYVIVRVAGYMGPVK